MSNLLDIDMESFARELGMESLHECLGELHRGTHARQVTAHFRQAEHARNLHGAVGIDGIGQVDMVIDPTVFHYWGARLGYDCWEDEEFLQEFKRDNPDARVRGAARRVTILNQWGRDAREDAAACASINHQPSTITLPK